MRREGHTEGQYVNAYCGLDVTAEQRNLYVIKYM